MNGAAKSPIWGRLLRGALALTALLFVVLSGWDIAKKWDHRSVTLDVRWLFLAVPCAFAATLCQAVAWRRLVEHWTGKSLPRNPAFALFFAGQLARYTPGKVGLPAMRMAGAQALGVAPSVMASTLLVETFVWGTSGGAAGAFFLSFFPDRVFSLGAAVAPIAKIGLIGALFGLVLVCSLDRRRLPLVVARKLHLEGGGPLVPVSAVGFLSLHWLLWIVHGGFVGLSLGATSFVDALLVGAALVLAIVVGFAAVLAPAGAGVREALMREGAAPVLGLNGALVAALIARAISLTTEVTLWLVFRGFGIPSAAKEFDATAKEVPLK